MIGKEKGGVGSGGEYGGVKGWGGRKRGLWVWLYLDRGVSVWWGERRWTVCVRYGWGDGGIYATDAPVVDVAVSAMMMAVWYVGVR